MARLWSCGFELNSTTAGVEFDSASGSIVTNIARSGTYAGKTTSFGQTFRSQYRASSTQESVFYRFYLYIESYPVGLQWIMVFYSDADAGKVSIRCNSDGTLELWNHEDSSQIGSDSVALSTGQWYRIEVNIDTTTLASTAVEAKLDGTTFASGTANLSAAIARMTITNNNVTTEGVYYYDDLAINDSSGSIQNSWPGEGEIIHLRPNAGGDNTDWSEGTDTSFAEVDEVTPDDATTHIGSHDLDNISDFNIDATPAALAADDTINCVQVGVRAGAENASQTTAFVLRIKSAAAGTVEESSNINITTTAYATNANTAPRNYALTLYDLPGASTTAWTKATLDTTQIGVRLTAEDGLDDARVSTLWLLVDHKPAEVVAGVSTPGYRSLLGVGI